MKSTMSMLVMVAVLGFAVVHAFPAEPPITFTATSTTTTTEKPELNPNHVPQSTCVNMSPVHGPHRPRNETAPYTVSVSTTRVAPGDTVKVTLSGTGDETFKGIYVQGRQNDLPVGQFLKPSNNQFVALSDCPPGEKNAASYVSNRVAVNQLVLDWIAPNTPGEITFVSTFVKTFSEFWVFVKSPVVKIVV